MALPTGHSRSVGLGARSLEFGDSLDLQRRTSAVKLLIIEDEPAIQEMVSSRLQRDGYDTFVAATAEEGTRIYRRMKPHLIVLDLMLPYMSGLDFCRMLRRESSTPIIVISAKAEELSRVQALESGADDYLVKPFSLSELSARVKAVLRRSQIGQFQEPIEFGSLRVDPRRHEVTKQGQAIELSPKEFALLHFLASHPGRVFSRTSLLDKVWGKDAFVSERTVDVHVRWLRSKIENDAAMPTFILTIRGVGYKFAG